MSTILKPRAFDMTVSANTYAGELALPYVSAAINAADTIANDRARIIEGVTRKAVINDLTASNPIQAASCTPSDGASVTLDEQVVTLNDLQVYEEVCRKTIFPTWVAAAGRMERNGELPGTFAEYLTALVAAKAGEQLERLLWTADSGSVWGLGFLSNDGTIDEGGIDASACKDFVEADLGTAFSASTIIGHLGAVYQRALAKPAMLSKPGFGFYVSYAAYGYYLQALATAGAASLAGQGYQNNVTNQSLGQVSYLGFPIYPTYGIPNNVNVIVATYPDNLVIATNSYTPETEAKLIPRYEYDGKDTVVISMNFAVGVNVAVPTDGVVGFNFT